MKRIIAIMLITVTAVMCFSGCKDNQKKEKTGNSSKAKTEIQSKNDTVSVRDAETDKKADLQIFQEYPIIDYEYPTTSLFERRNVQQLTFYDEYARSSMAYGLILPKDFNESKKYPVFVFLHGVGERGNDNVMQLSLVNNLYHASEEYMDSAIVIAPQCPAGGDWVIHNSGSEDYNGPLSTVRRIIEDVATKYPTDSSRYYIMGVSMGGYGTWRMAAEYSDMFAAAVPICGGGNPDDAESLCKTPIWVYHGTADDVVPFYSSEQMYNAIVYCGGTDIRFTQLIDCGHNAWDYAIGDDEMFEWMFSQRK